MTNDILLELEKIPYHHQNKFGELLTILGSQKTDQTIVVNHDDRDNITAVFAQSQSC